MNQHDILIIGCGLSGIVIAEQFANKLNKKCLIIDKRDHIGGNVYDYIDSDTNILMNKYYANFYDGYLDEVLNNFYISDAYHILPHSLEMLSQDENYNVIIGVEK